MKKFLCAILIAIICLMVVSCGENDRLGIELKYDNQINIDGHYNQNLLYRNDLETFGADPQVIYISDKNSSEYGYYYLYCTTSTQCFICYRSKDLIHWENISQIIGNPAYYPEDEDYAYDNLWAPEVIWDATSGKYFMFYSGKMKTGLKWTIGVLESENPYGPFKNKTHDFLFKSSEIMPILKEKYPERFDEETDCFATLDPSPYIAPNGTKYLYFVSEQTVSIHKTCVFGIEMSDWNTPIYKTVKMLTKTCYTTVAGNELNESEGISNCINEGPTMIERVQLNGSYKYYLTLSINGYRDKSYSVIQAIGDSPLGPFEKLKYEEGGILLGTDFQSWDHVSGTGHHCFIEREDQLYIIYHQHVDKQNGGAERAYAIDRVEWIKNSKGVEIMYANGPTYSLQPLPNFVSEYSNIARDAIITSSDKTDVSCLNDGLISLYSYINFVKEFKSNKKIVLTLKFQDYRKITGIMIYNSKNYNTAFDKISKIIFEFKDEVKNYTGIAYINNLEFDWNMYKNANANMMRPGGSAIALFNPIMVKSIVITIAMPNDRVVDQDEEGYYIYQKEVALSEIVVLGN